MQEFNENIAISFNFDKENSVPLEPLYFGVLKTNNNNFTIEYQENKLPNYQNIHNKQFELYGQTLSGKKFIATDCFFQRVGGGTMIQNGLLLNSNSIFINKLFIGDWDLNIKSKKIKNISIRFSYLEYWLHSLKIEHKLNDKKISEMCIENLDFEFKKFNINDEFTFTIHTSFITNTEGNKKFIFDSKKWINLSFNNYITIDEAYQIIFILNNFFRILLPSKKIFVEDLSIKTEDDKSYEVLYRQTNYKNEDTNTSWTDFLNLYNESTIKDILSNWFNIQSQYGMVMDSLFSILDDKSFVYLENRFIAYMQWLEGFARIAYPTTEDQKLEFENRIKNIINQISSEDDKELINNITQFKFETPLRQQLKVIISDYKIKNILKINSNEIKSLINKLSLYRNKLTHTNNTREYESSELVYLNIILKNILYIIFHKKLLLDKDSIAYQKVTNDLVYSYKQYKQQMRNKTE